MLYVLRFAAAAAKIKEGQANYIADVHEEII